MPGFRIATAVLIAVCASSVDRTLARQPAATVEHLGDYAQLRETDEHVYGYVLQLWRDGTEVSDDERQSLGRAEWLAQTDGIPKRHKPRC